MLNSLKLIAAGFIFVYTIGSLVADEPQFTPAMCQALLTQVITDTDAQLWDDKCEDILPLTGTKYH